MSLEIDCNFEEVYTSGEIQNGVLLYKNKMRYEYYDHLYTLIYKNNNFISFIILIQKLSKKLIKT